MKSPPLWLVRMCSVGRSWLRPEQFTKREDAKAFADTLGGRREVVFNNEVTAIWTYAVVERWKPVCMWDAIHGAWVRISSGPQDQVATDSRFMGGSSASGKGSGQ